MPDYQLWLTFGVFIITVIFLMWRPGGLNESIPTSLGALLLILTGVSSYAHIVGIFGIVSGAAVTILSTIVMSIILDSIGFFRWIALNMIEKARGSGFRLFWLILLLCFLMTIFFNNDGSILITTPIIIRICSILRLKMHQQLPYLISGALIATASSAPIGLSNLANLIALQMVGLNLNTYTQMMFVPSMLAIMVMTVLLFYYFRRSIPKVIHHFPVSLQSSSGSGYHPLQTTESENKVDWWLFRVCIGIVVFIRAGYFLAEQVGIRMEVVAITGVILMLAVRWYRTRTGLKDVITQTPWHILLFAFSIYVIVDSLHRAGMTASIIQWMKPIIEGGNASIIAVSGLMLTLLSNLFNNLPSVMIGTFAVTDLPLSESQLHLAYLANILGSDIGALLTPIGTLATLIWMYILKTHHIRISWKQYMKVTFIVIPISLIVSLISLYIWTSILY
ncbi:arsenic transporter [Paenibacillus amylolyticus]|uniref:arsenic transporter n=1 Tax=Paenibacillus TaxID=44249 RepID=UPI0003E252BC|nr:MULTISPECIES: arsenic transporter [Paenibacillus]ETT33106.1 Arsenical pump membrane protein [Paenibacillus sp. FSL R5-192]ETT54973.1 Arsenical pump membrane protein [Paenibacillus sp. FSL H7-689]OME95899.1 arsenic transporter [Paenibacillus amylolyticus]OMF02495.1 arsenic transporter [Paenibacillus amylolyticus]